jgi:multifunctional beta-oxidation protein
VDWLPNYNYVCFDAATWKSTKQRAFQGKLLHGEQYLKIHGEIPTQATLINKAKILEVLDKGKAAVVTMVSESRDKSTGKLLFSGSATVFIREAGNFKGKTRGTDFGPSTAVNRPPSRRPDHIAQIKTDKRQAAIYRLECSLW